MERTDALKIVAMLTAAYPAWRPTRETVELYAEMIQSLPKEAVQQAVMGIIRNDQREFAPPVSLIIRGATNCALERVDRPALSVEDAWLLVERAIRDRGYYQGAGGLGGNAAVRRAVEAIGWQNICVDENIAATRAHFFRLFERFQENEVRTAADLLSCGQSLPEHTAPAQVDYLKALPAPSTSIGERARRGEDGIERGRQLFRDFVKGMKSIEAA